MTPDGWFNTTLGEVVRDRIRNGYSPNCPATPTGRWMLSLGAVTPSGFNPNGVKPAPANDPRLDAAKLMLNDIVVSRSNTRERVGLAGVYSGEPQECFYPDLLMRVRVAERVDPVFLCNVLLAAEGRAYFQRTARGTSGSMVKIDRALLEAFPMALPPLSEQRKIAAILSSVDDAIEATQAVIEQLQVVKKAMMAELLTRGLPGRHKKFKMTEIGEVPEEWNLCSIDVLGPAGEATVRTGPFGSSMKTKDFRLTGVPVLTIQSLGQGEALVDGLFYVDDAKADELAAYKVRPNDVVFSRVADIGRCVAIEQREAGWLISPNLSRIRLDPAKANARFLMYLITASEAVLRQVEAVAGNAGRPVITSTTLKALQLPLPQLDEQAAIAAAGLEVEARILAETETLRGLVNAKSALMSVLLTGEVRVKPDEDAA